MKKNFVDFDQVITYNRIKQTLKNMIKTDFLNLHHIHASNHAKAIKAAKQGLTAYCDKRLRNPNIRQILIDRITLYTYDVNPDLQYSYSKELFKDKLSAKIDMMWLQLRDLSFDDWAEFSDKPTPKTASHSLLQRLKNWL